jgi:small subunit ribosomal protein S17
MAKKTFTGQVVSDKMQKTVVVEIVRFVAHPIYKKRVKKTTKLKADTNGLTPKIGQFVKIEQARPMSRGKNFVVTKIAKEGDIK